MPSTDDAAVSNTHDYPRCPFCKGPAVWAEKVQEPVCEANCQDGMWGMRAGFTLVTPRGF